MNYYDLKFLHYAFVIIMIASQATLFVKSQKLHKMILGITTLFSLITGFLLLMKLGISPTGPYPVWIIIKLAVWIVLSVIFPIIFKRFSSLTKLLYLPWLMLLLMAIGVTIYKV